MEDLADGAEVVAAVGAFVHADIWEVWDEGRCGLVAVDDEGEVGC